MSKLWAIIFVLALSAVSARASVILNEADFMSVLQEEFAEQGHDESLELEFFGGQTTYVFDDAEKAKIMISQLKINDEQGRFSAKGEIFADGNLRAVFRLLFSRSESSDAASGRRFSRSADFRFLPPSSCPPLLGLSCALR